MISGSLMGQTGPGCRARTSSIPRAPMERFEPPPPPMCPAREMGDPLGPTGVATFWLFGGHAFDSVGTYGELNDLWKFDGLNWTWVSGAPVANQSGSFGTLGTASSSNTPSSRAWSTSWTDPAGTLWLFGGGGYD